MFLKHFTSKNQLLGFYISRTSVKYGLIFISRKETGEKTSEFGVELSKIEGWDKIMENSYTMFQIKVVLNIHRFLLLLENRLSSVNRRSGLYN